MKRIFWAFICLLCVAGVLHGADNEKDHYSFWIKNHYPVDGKVNPLVDKAKQVFEKVYAAADKRGSSFPRLIVIKEKGDPWALAIKDGSVILTEGALNLCYRGVPEDVGNARLAFLLGHELAHLSKGDFWHFAAFSAVSQYGETQEGECQSIIALLRETSDVPPDFKTSCEKLTGKDGKPKGFQESEAKEYEKMTKKAHEKARMKELQADSYGLIYMALAGYAPNAIVGDTTNFIQDFISQITTKVAYTDTKHPTVKERAHFLKAELKKVSSYLDLFHFGMRLYQLGNYEDAIYLFVRYGEEFPGREVFNNIGLSYYQLAVRALGGCDPRLPSRFKLSQALDTDTLASVLRGTKGEGDSVCLQEEAFRGNIKEAIRYLERAQKSDPSYKPARLNLASAYILAGEYSKAMGVAEEVLKIDPDNPEALCDKAVALYLFGPGNNLNTADNALDELNRISKKHPQFSNALYNAATILAERGRNAAAEEMRKRFLVIEPSGYYSDVIRKELREKPLTRKMSLTKAKFAPPIPLGKPSPQTQAILKNMISKPFTIGKLDVIIYEGLDQKALMIGNSIEMIEKNLVVSLAYEEYQKKVGHPSKIIIGPLGKTVFYNTMALDVKDGQVTTIFYYPSQDLL